jgi:hypothetical protein
MSRRAASGLGVLLLALLAAHALLWAWGQGYLGGNPGSAQREPAWLAAQQNPQRWQLLSPEAASAARQPLQCREIGAFNDEAALQAAEDALQKQLRLPPGSWQRSPRDLPGVYLLATQGSRNAAEVTRRRAQLERAGISNFRPQNLMGEREASWVLERYDSEAQAQAALQQLRAGKGLNELRVVTQRISTTQWWLRLPGLTVAQAKATHPAWPGGMRPCTPDAPEVPAAAAASAVNAASAASTAG